LRMNYALVTSGERSTLRDFAQLVPGPVPLE
jgi:hypothetical protein